MSDFIIHTDGGSRGNPGPAAIGAVIHSSDGALKKEYGQYIGVATNNEAEYQAVLFALKKLKLLIGKEKASTAHIALMVDSELLERQVNGHFKIMHPTTQKLFLEYWNLKQDFGPITVSHVYREENKAADRMVNAALDKELNKLV